MSGSRSSSPGDTDGVPDEPLGLTIHGLPSPAQAMDADARQTRSGRWKMLAVLAVCAAPVIASYFTYYVVRPEGRRNFGELIEPQRPMPPVTARALDDRPVDLRSLQQQWLLVSVGGGRCDAACERRLYLQRQLRESLGRDKDRLDRVWLIDDGTPPRAELLPALRAEGSQVLRVDAAALATWLAPSAGRRIEDHLYVVDPMGHWMLRFPADLDVAAAARAKRDLERLMRGSAGWDQPGRPESSR